MAGGGAVREGAANGTGDGVAPDGGTGTGAGAGAIEGRSGADGRGGFPDRAERVLILAMIGGILILTLSPRVLWMYQAGLGLLISATFLQIAVGNLPKHFGFAASVKRILLILGIIVLVFVVGIVLVPILSGLGT